MSEFDEYTQAGQEKHQRMIQQASEWQRGRITPIRFSAEVSASPAAAPGLQHTDEFGNEIAPISKSVEIWGTHMTTLLRLTGLLLAICGGLIAASIVLGHLSKTDIVIGNMDIESQIYTIYVEDVTHHLRIRLEGTRCFEALPPWVYPDLDAPPITPPTTDPGTFFAELVNDIMEVLTRCRP